MKSKDSEYRELFMAEAHENFEELNRLFIILEKDSKNSQAIHSIFRIIHTLKGNSLGMGFTAIADLTHVMEDVMGAIKGGTIQLSAELFESLYRSNDKLGELIRSLETREKVSYLGIKTRLEVMLKNIVQAPGDLQEEATKGPEEDHQEITFGDVIQIPVKKLDELMNLVGQLIIERDRLISGNMVNGRRNPEFEGLQRISSSLQYSIINARMVQVGFLFNKFHRILRDAAVAEGKNVNLVLKGTETEIDRNVLKVISDSMIHLVRNAVSHGIEPTEHRRQLSKSESGTVTLNSRYEKDNVVITINDDGRGIDADQIRKKIVEKNMLGREAASRLSDEEVITYIFEQGFSNAEKVTEISGRGIGMDVVKKAVESIGGQVQVETEVGKGTTISLHLPSSLAMKGALLFELGGQEYAVPLSYTEAVVSLKRSEIHKISHGLMTKYLDSSIPLVFLQDLVTITSLAEIGKKGALHQTFMQQAPDSTHQVIVVANGSKMFGIAVDRLLQQKEIMEKTLPKPIEKVKLLSGTTILGNGNVCPVIDIPAIAELLFKSLKK